MRRVKEATQHDLEIMSTDYVPHNRTYTVGSEVTNRQGDIGVILGRISGIGKGKNRRKTSYLLQFGKGMITKVVVSDMGKGSFSDPSKPTVYGVGYLGLGDHATAYDGVPNLAYSVWKGVLRRTSTSYGKATYVDAMVAPEWLNFQNFADWFEVHFKDGYSIDADLKRVHGKAKLYSPKTCCMVPKWLSSYYNNVGTNGADAAVGVRPAGNGYSVEISDFREGTSSSYYGGTFKTYDRAFEVFHKLREQMNFLAQMRAYKEGLTLDLVVLINKA